MTYRQVSLAGRWAGGRVGVRAVRPFSLGSYEASTEGRTTTWRPADDERPRRGEGRGPGRGRGRVGRETAGGGGWAEASVPGGPGPEAMRPAPSTLENERQGIRSKLMVTM